MGANRRDGRTTPGPWKVCKDTFDGGLSIGAEDNGKTTFVATVICGWFEYRSDGPPQIVRDSDLTGHANARLISAAPDLLDACKFALSRFCDPHSCDTDPASLMFKTLAEAAIAKAEGT